MADWQELAAIQQNASLVDEDDVTIGSSETTASDYLFDIVYLID